ncbi:MAG: tetratricopeptide repeat protein [Endomicrobiales bacterium]|nr:tetratricopeptide repeat protein [Endomicrobiales bacterium]
MKQRKTLKMYEDMFRNEPERVYKIMKGPGLPMDKGVEQVYKKTIEANPENSLAYLALGDLYAVSGRAKEAEWNYRKGMEIDPKNFQVYIRLGEFYMLSGKTKEAERMFKKGIEVDPEKFDAYAKLSDFYRVFGKKKEAERIYREAMEIGKMGGGVYKTALELHNRQDMFKDAYEQILILAKEKCFNALWIHLELSRYYKKKGDIASYNKEREIINTYYRESRWSEQNRYKTTTNSNYLEYVRKVQSKGVKLICMQYPARSIKPLKEMLDGCEGVTFVSNEMNFKNAIVNGDYWGLFKDYFAGDFGHCNEKGNRLIAENLADVILNRVVKR